MQEYGAHSSVLYRSIGLIPGYYAGVWGSFISIMQEYEAHTSVLYRSIGLIPGYYAGVWG
jgi:hypothetical protein